MNAFKKLQNYHESKSNHIGNQIKLNHSELAKIVPDSNQKPMNHQSNHFAVYPKIHILN